MKWWITTCCVLLGLAFPAITSAQEPAPPPVLVVTVRDSAGQGVPGIEVLVRDRSGATELGRAVTDASGQARFATLPVNDIRVALVGRLGDGTALRQEGDDARGIALVLSLPPNMLDLVIEPDGKVLPDPTTMLALDSGVPVDVSLPTALPAMTPVLTVPTPQTLPTPDVPSPTPSATDISLWGGIALAMVLAGIIVTLLLLVSRWRQGR